MKKKLFAMLALALALALLGGSALAVTGDITVKAVKAYSDAAMTQYIGTIPSYTSVLVRSYDSYADIYVNGTICYIEESALLHDGTAHTRYGASLKKGTTVYQRADSDAKSAQLTCDCSVTIVAVKGDWALVRNSGKTGVYAFVKVDRLSGIHDLNVVQSGK